MPIYANSTINPGAEIVLKPALSKLKHIGSFDGLRAISIICVLLNHLGIYLLLPKTNFFQQRVWPLFAGGTGVNIFFVLSGFLITRILLTEMEGKGNISLKHFYIRRALRLLPALLLFFTIIAGLMIFHLLFPSVASFFYSFFYLYNFVPPSLQVPELIHTWSLAVEEQFYFTWPLILILFNSRKAFYIGAFLICLCILAKIILPGIKITVGDRSLPFTEVYRTGTWFIPAVAPIIIGSIMSIAIFNNKGIAESIHGNHRFCLFLSFILFISPLYLASFLAEYAYFIQSLGVALLLAVLLLNQKTMAAGILGAGPLAYVGKISYGIYVFQGLFLRNGPGGKLLIQQFPQNLVLTLLCAILSYHFVEKPILRLKEKFR